MGNEERVGRHLSKNFKGGTNMTRDFRRIPPKLAAGVPQRRATREIAALPKGSKRILNNTGGRNVLLSPSQPHSKTCGR